MRGQDAARNIAIRGAMLGSEWERPRDISEPKASRARGAARASRDWCLGQLNKVDLMRIVVSCGLTSLASLLCCFLKVGESRDKVLTLPEFTILAFHQLLRFLDGLFLVRTFHASYC